MAGAGQWAPQASPHEAHDWENRQSAAGKGSRGWSLRPLLASWADTRRVCLRGSSSTRSESEDKAWFLGCSRNPRPRWLAGQGQGRCVSPVPLVPKPGALGPGAVFGIRSTEPWLHRREELRLDFGAAVPLRTRVNRQLVLTNRSPIQTPFTLKFEFFGSSPNSLSQKPSL